MENDDFSAMSQQRILNGKPRRRGILGGILPVIATLIAVAGLSYLGWNAYQENANGPVDPAKIPVAKADPKPYKTVAENQPQENAADLDKKVYDAISPSKSDDDSDSGIKVVTQTEEPIERKTQKTEETQKTAATADNPQPNNMQTAANGDESDDEEVTETAKPVENPAIIEEKPAPVAASAIVPEKKSTEVKPAPAKLIEAKPVETKREKEPLPKMVKKNQSMAKGLKIQLGAFKSNTEAKEQWEKIHKKHKSLGELKPIIEKAEVKNKGTFYRLQAGPVKSEDAAKLLCKKLIAAKQGCFIVNPK